MSLSLNFRQASYAQETGIFPICLVTIDHDDLGSPIRLSTDQTERLDETASEIVYGTTSNSIEYYFFPAGLILPDDTDEGPGILKFTFDNITRDYMAIIRGLDGAPTIDVDMVMSNALNTVEKSWPTFEITRIDYDAGLIELSATLETLINEPYPAGNYTPSFFISLFRGL